jgi:hypothetical protein
MKRSWYRRWFQRICPVSFSPLVAKPEFDNQRRMRFPIEVHGDLPRLRRLLEVRNARRRGVIKR